MVATVSTKTVTKSIHIANVSFPYYTISFPTTICKKFVSETMEKKN